MRKKFSVQKIFRHEYSFLILFICLNLVIGFFIVDNYGITPDEPLSWEFGTEGLLMYLGKGKVVDVDYSHGGGFLIPAKAGQLAISFLFPNWIEPYTWHYVYHLFFQLSIIFIYLLAKQFVGTWGANFSAFLFASQPLFWGHSFMNPKDTPFMTLFLGSIILGINLTERFKKIDWSSDSFFDNIRLSISENRKKDKLKSRLIISLTLIGLYLFFMLGTPIIINWIEAFVTQLYTADPDTLFGKIFASFASNAENLPLDRYISKGIRFYQKLEKIGNLTVFPLLLIGSFYWLFPHAIRYILSSTRKIISTKQFLVAVIIVGMCISARVMGIVTIGIISLYMLLKLKKKSLLLILLFVIGAVIASFVLWPDLWETPLKTFKIYLKNMVEFENWRLRILFEGEIYDKFNYPNHYIPKLIGLQFTEPALILSLTGMVVAAIKTWQKKYDWVLIGLLAGWLFAPLVLAVILHPVVYNNFRHFFFILPPIFIFAGIGIEFILQRINKHTLKILLLALLILPGLVGIIQLHPYEYIYYNSFAGGVEGAFREYELDYWLTGYKAAMEYLNETAVPDSWVSVVGEKALISWFAREDINIESRPESDGTAPIKYIMVPTNNNKDKNFEEKYSNTIELHAVECRGIPLIKVYEFITSD